MRLIDGTQHRDVLTCLGKQPQDRKTHQEPLGCGPLQRAGCHPKRSLMALGERLHVLGQWCQQSLQTREGNRGFRFEADQLDQLNTFARAATSCSSAVLPIPGSPRISIEPLTRLRAPMTIWPMANCCCSRPSKRRSPVSDPREDVFIGKNYQTRPAVPSPAGQHRCESGAQAPLGTDQVAFERDRHGPTSVQCSHHHVKEGAGIVLAARWSAAAASMSAVPT